MELTYVSSELVEEQNRLNKVSRRLELRMTKVTWMKIIFLFSALKKYPTCAD